MKRSHGTRRAALLSALALLVLPLAVQASTGTPQSGVSTASDLKLAASTLSTRNPFKPPAPNCGATVYKATGGPWKCTFADEFGGSSLDASKWSAQQTAISGLHSGEECLVDSPNNVSVLNGVLRLTTRREAAPFTCRSPYGDYTTQYTSGGVTTYGKFSQTYGRFEFRAKFPAQQASGLQTALWLYPTSNNYGAWPASGEIDVAEYYSNYPDRAIPYVHYNTASDVPTSGISGVTNWFCKMADLSSFHTYVAEWTSKGIKIMYDGVTCLDHVWDPASPLVAPKPFDKPFAILMTQVLGTGSNTFSADTTILPATTEIDWVRAWS